MDNHFLPHIVCYRYNLFLVLMHLVSDFVIWLSYMAISGVLAWIAWKRRFAFRGFFIAFAGFIVCCGFTHAMGFLDIWFPWYYLDGIVKSVTAVFSLATAAVLFKARGALMDFITGRLDGDDPEA